jgi:branched-chain amino acid transport system permease protein
MIDFFQTISNGIIIGGTYALMAVGLTVIFGFMDIVNFAHGELYMLGAYFAFTFIVIYGMPVFLGIPLAALSVMILGYLIERFLLKPVSQGGVIPSMLTTVGLMVLFQNAALLIWTGIPRRVPFEMGIDRINLGEIWLSPVQLIVVAITLLIVVGAHAFMQYTTSGIAMRATFQDKEIAQIMGINAKWVYTYSFVFGSGLAALGGVLLSMVYNIFPTMGSFATLKAFAVVVLGGLGSFLGAIAAGLLLGVAESITATYFLSDYKDVLAFVLLLLILMIKPTGLFGKSKGVE